jgi:mannose-6-phosphate isomerase-like protein (cupin superfamily)
MEHSVINLVEKAAQVTGDYANYIVATINDHVVRMAVMTKPFYWHKHPNSDETFLVLEGTLVIDLDDKTIELMPGQLFTVQKNIWHRTRPGEDRSVNLTFESGNMETIKRV